MPENLVFNNKNANLDFTKNLINWGLIHGRNNLPWSPDHGSEYDIYKVWISEVMMQQTQLITGMKFFNRFISVFPKVEILAKADIESILTLWSGLGYYARARNLHKSAKLICTNGKAVFPTSAKEWEKLPGVGQSTAAAIAAFVFRERVAITDANVTRILSRKFMLKDFIGTTILKKKINTLATKLLPAKKKEIPIYTQSIMDLGALICKPQNPTCELCPIKKNCGSYLLGQTNSFPKRKKLPPKEKKTINWLIPVSMNFIALSRKNHSNLWKELWVPIELKNMPKNAKNIKKYETNLSNFILDANIWIVRCKKGSYEGPVKWVKKTEIESSPIPETIKKIISGLSL